MVGDSLYPVLWGLKFVCCKVLVEYGAAWGVKAVIAGCLFVRIGLSEKWGRPVRDRS